MNRPIAQLQRHGDVLVLVVDNPPVNTITAAARTAMSEALTHAAADGKGHEAALGYPSCHVEDGAAALARSCDVVQHEFVRTLVVVVQRQLDGVADVSQFTELGAPELLTAGHAPGVDV